MNEIDILQVHEEIMNFGKLATAMFNLIPEYLMEKGDDKYEKLRKKIYKYEEQSDDIDRGITHFLTRISENNLSEANSRRITAMFKITDDIESIADQCVQMERTIQRKNEAKAWFSQEMRDELFSLFSLVNEALITMNENLSHEYRPGILAKAAENEIKINELRDKLLLQNKQRIESGENDYKYTEFYVELIKHCESLADHVINVNQAIASNTK
jgi:phosphate:Na+ symporter